MLTFFARLAAAGTTRTRLAATSTATTPTTSALSVCLIPSCSSQERCTLSGSMANTLPSPARPVLEPRRSSTYGPIRGDSSAATSTLENLPGPEDRVHGSGFRVRNRSVLSTVGRLSLWEGSSQCDKTSFVLSGKHSCVSYLRAPLQGPADWYRGTSTVRKSLLPGPKGVSPRVFLQVEFRCACRANLKLLRLIWLHHEHTALAECPESP
jgi:hypothetical protein